MRYLGNVFDIIWPLTVDACDTVFVAMYASCVALQYVFRVETHSLVCTHCLSVIWDQTRTNLSITKPLIGHMNPSMSLVLVAQSDPLIKSEVLKRANNLNRLIDTHGYLNRRVAGCRYNILCLIS